MGVRGHRSVACGLCFLRDHLDELNQLALKLVDCVTHKQTQIGSDLLVAAASRVQLEPNISSEFDQTTFEEMMNVFGLAVLHEVWIGFSSMLDVFQSIEQRLQFRCREHTGTRERTSVRAAGGDLLRQESLVEWKRPLPLLEFRIQRPAEPA